MYSFSSWSETASIAVNGNSLWTSNDNCHPPCKRIQTIPIPGARITPSSVIIVVPSGSLSVCCSDRVTHMSFVDDSLRLPTGLQYVLGR